jgi:dolichol-phosphate mannosyltransferase
MNKYTLGICAFNEGEKIRQVVERFSDHSLYDLVIVDDGSTDRALDSLPNGSPIKVIRNDQTKGAGHGVRQILTYAREKGYTAVFFVSGNNKDCPEDIIKLKQGIEEGFDLVQGSRYIPGGEFGNMPLYRKLSTRFMHPFLFSMFTGRRITDSTNGFRAVRLAILADKRINLDQEWLDHYELEPYLFYKAIQLGYRVKEVPVRKIYPPKAHGYTKMKPVTGWWSILRPLFYLWLGIKK